MKVDPALLAPRFTPLRTAAPRSAESGFRLPQTERPTEPGRTGPLARTETLHLVAALAGADSRDQKRKRRQRHAHALLDRLDGLQRELAGGRRDPATLDALAATLKDAGDASDDPALEAIVEAVELRAAVEIAKMKAARRRV